MNRPFLLKPSGKDYLWGGNRINDDFGKDINLSPLAESWECSVHEDGPSIVASGEHKGKSLKEVLESNPLLLGKKHKQLPILIKFIDADKDLSVQVHPNDEQAKTDNDNGKTEMWYVLDATKDAKLVYGFNKDCSSEEVRAAIKEGTLLDKLQIVDVKKNDVFFIEPGTVHAIGAGSLIAEIQESSNLTYRLYDYDRVDKQGKKRELHIDKALEVANLNSSSKPRQPMRVLKYENGVARELLARCRYFEVYRMLLNTERRQEVEYRSDCLSFRVLLCIDGCGVISFADESLNFYRGDCFFIPADSYPIRLHGAAQFLDVRG